MIFIIIILCIVIVLLCIYIIKIHRTIGTISKQVNLVLYGQKDIYEQSYQEGHLSLLENDIAKLTYRLQEHNALLLKEKQLLKESLEDISHQIKTPLTALNLIQERLRYVDEHEKRKLYKEQMRLLYKIEWLVQALLKIAQIDARTIEFKKESILASTLINQVLNSFEIPIELKDIHVSLSKENTLFHNIDILWTQEALSNIVKKCIEHLNEQGKLLISFDSNPLYQEIIIEDNGGGIDKEDLPFLFERFYKGKNTTHESIGIGLALTRMIIENQNGTIIAENSEVGARFIIHFYKEIV